MDKIVICDFKKNKANKFVFPLYFYILLYFEINYNIYFVQEVKTIRF
jgi:hypothetical protein